MTLRRLRSTNSAGIGHRDAFPVRHEIEVTDAIRESLLGPHAWPVVFHFSADAFQPGT